jgi:hypothetical protein
LRDCSLIGIKFPVDRLDVLREAPPSDERLSQAQREAAKRERWLLFVEQATGYCLFFRNGPERVRRAYDAYLGHVRKTGDVKGAWRHLHELGLDTLRVQAAAWCEKTLRAP